MSTTPQMPSVGLGQGDDALVIAERSEPIPHVFLQGTLDTLRTPQFTSYMRGRTPSHRGWLLIDAAALGMLTSCGAGALIELASNASKSGGGVALVVPPGQVRDVIGFMRLDMVIDTFDSLDSAVAHIDGQTTPAPGAA